MCVSDASGFGGGFRHRFRFHRFNDRVGKLRRTGLAADVSRELVALPVDALQRRPAVGDFVGSVEGGALQPAQRLVAAAGGGQEVGAQELLGLLYPTLFSESLWIPVAQALSVAIVKGDDSQLVGLASPGLDSATEQAVAISNAVECVDDTWPQKRDGWEADLTRSTPHAANEAIAGCRAGVAVAELGPDVHGVGLGYEVLGPDDVLEPGMVLSVGADGTRDTVLVTDGEPDVLTM